MNGPVETDGWCAGYPRTHSGNFPRGKASPELREEMQVERHFLRSQMEDRVLDPVPALNASASRAPCGLGPSCPLTQHSLT